MEFAQSKGLTGPETVQTMVVYDARTGRIAHTHIVVTFPGVQRHDTAALHSRALEMADLKGVKPQNAKVLSVPESDMAPGFEYSVDVQRPALVRGHALHTIARSN